MFSAVGLSLGWFEIDQYRVEQAGGDAHEPCESIGTG